MSLPLTRPAPFEEILAFPVEPEDVPLRAVRYVQRTLLRHPDYEPPADEDEEEADYLARVIVAGVIAILAEGGRAEEAARFGAAYAAATGATVLITAAGD